MTKTNDFTQEELWEGVEYTLDAIGQVSGQSRSCLIGGTALCLHGLRKDTGDIDLLVFLRPKCEKCLNKSCCIRSSLVRNFPDRFSVRDAKKPGADYMVLLYWTPLTRCPIKVDILVSTDPKVEIPNSLGMDDTDELSGYPVAPLEFLLYHKLLGWQKRMESEYEYEREKAKTKDKNDILSLCSHLATNGLRPLDVAFGSSRYNGRLRLRSERFIREYGNEARHHLVLVGLPGY
ncbi:hypothetical protein FRC20_002733 [Serendipita sp. 405]|nr:hypothetical protein FRC20_002733 [Serendipita sp. 405]